MSMTSTNAFLLKGSLFTLTVLHLQDLDPIKLNDQLRTLALQAPGFFERTPVVLDLHKLIKTPDIDFSLLLSILREHGLIPVGARGGSPKQMSSALEAGLAVFPEAKSEAISARGAVARAAKPEKISQQTKVITHPVRSGQQIYAPNGDLVVLAPVSPGAELIAEGSIHVYDVLHGRALAGVNGNTSARIFCRKLEAQLVAIAGNFWVSEDITAMDPPEGAVQVYLENDRLNIANL